MTNQSYCQSCAMPLNEELLGSNADGSKNPDYCLYCYEKGAFKQDCTMEEMIEFCAPHMAAGGKMSEQAAREAMRGFFPQMKRWRRG
ncbi:MAG: zinc ribbon domain-containing protein [Christensenellaceae bacterium]|jgi:hypothetical protein|nr:zinc ribbon domain-containing protein [Christensenellaceae bacterium]